MSWLKFYEITALQLSQICIGTMPVGLLWKAIKECPVRGQSLLLAMLSYTTVIMLCTIDASLQRLTGSHGLLFGRLNYFLIACHGRTARIQELSLSSQPLKTYQLDQKNLLGSWTCIEI